MAENKKKTNEVRIQKAMADCGEASRRAAEQMVEAGRVTVNGHPAKIGQKVDPFKDIIAVDGRKLETRVKRRFCYIALNKPRGYVTTLSDEQGRKCVADLVRDVPERVYPIGRLDRNSEGLLLLTNDGAFANRVMHPSHGVPKAYRVTVRPDVTDKQLLQLAEGVELDGVRTAPAQVEVLEKQAGRVVMQIVITEGRNRQIRRMCEAVGLEVARLKRVSEGPVRLAMLQPGKWRALTEAELTAFRAMMDGAARKAAAGGAPGRQPAPVQENLGPKTGKHWNQEAGQSKGKAYRPRTEGKPYRTSGDGTNPRWKKPDDGHRRPDGDKGGNAGLGRGADKRPGGYQPRGGAGEGPRAKGGAYHKPGEGKPDGRPGAGRPSGYSGGSARPNKPDGAYHKPGVGNGGRPGEAGRSGSDKPRGSWGSGQTRGERKPVGKQVYKKGRG